MNRDGATLHLIFDLIYQAVTKFIMGSFLPMLLYFTEWASAATIYFAVNLTWANHTVAGVQREIILTDGQYPGPELRLNQGDDVYFDVYNGCPFNVTVHFHGRDDGFCHGRLCAKIEFPRH
jgi:FtsP/CotA-like multicopper oxidase with cupredoxin domain